MKLSVSKGSFAGTNSIGYNGKRYDGGTGWYDNGNKYLQSTYNESDERSDEWIRNAYRDDFDK